MADSQLSYLPRYFEIFNVPSPSIVVPFNTWFLHQFNPTNQLLLDAVELYHFLNEAPMVSPDPTDDKKTGSYGSLIASLEFHKTTSTFHEYKYTQLMKSGVICLDVEHHPSRIIRAFISNDFTSWLLTINSDHPALGPKSCDTGEEWTQITSIS